MARPTAAPEPRRPKSAYPRLELPIAASRDAIARARAAHAALGPDAQGDSTDGRTPPIPEPRWKTLRGRRTDRIR